MQVNLHADFSFFTEVISKLIQKNNKDGIIKKCKGSFDPALPEGYAVTRAVICMITAENALL